MAKGGQPEIVRIPAPYAAVYIIAMCPVTVEEIRYNFQWLSAIWSLFFVH